MRRIHISNPLNDILHVIGQLDQQARQGFSSFKTDDQWSPNVNIQSAKDSFTISVDLPGVDMANVDIECDKNVLTIKGTRTKEVLEEGAKWDRNESSFGAFSRQFNLPDTVDQTNISASGHNGVLKVVLKKKEEAAPIKVEIR